MSIHLETAWDSLCKYGEELCGDKVIVDAGPHGVIAVLSDGLGSGVKANILSTLTSKIITTMLGSGSGIEECVETVAETLPVCAERGIAYSTFTILRIDNAGHGYLAEYDNPSAVFLRGGKPVEWKRAERLIAGKRILEATFEAAEGDMIIAFSDGVVHAGVGKVLNLGWQRPHVVEYLANAWRRDVTALTMMRQLLAACNSLYEQKPGDDATVVTVAVRRPVPLTVMVGPPVDSAADDAVVRDFLGSPGLKAVCGGTTSQIISRAAGRQLTAEINYVSKDVPPIGHIEGIDLVTEGVLTLGKTLEIIDRYRQAPAGEAVNLLNAEDGATQLARLLVQECTEVRFMVGRALNPAHQNPNLPISLALKLQLVNDIAGRLRDLGKAVTVENT